MNLSVPQWLAIAALDLIIRAAYMAFPNVFLLSTSLKLSLFHLGLLIPITCIVAIFKLQPKLALPTIFIPTNVIFVSVALFTWADSIRRGRETFCVSHGCFWEKGSITGLGLSNMAQESFGQVVVNVVPLLAVWIFCRWRKDPIPK
jgi:hypothetical protein